jgi:hypothetical protein
VEHLTDIGCSWFRSRKYYFVQISTGESTWDLPTMAAPHVPTPGGTPAQGTPYGAPSDGMQGQEGERGLGVSAVMGKGMLYTDTSFAEYIDEPSPWRRQAQLLATELRHWRIGISVLGRQQ